MQYKYYKYTLTDEKGKEVGPDHHYDLFQSATGADMAGQYAEYYGKKNSVLMHLLKFGSDFSGLVGKHSTERDITKYNQDEDETGSATVEDDDYPHAAFVCMPRLGIIACLDNSKMPARSAMSRLHVIIGHRTANLFIIDALRESQDLRKAVSRFRLTEVSYEVRPVNPHTGPLGKAFDEDRARDHIQKVKGKMEAPEAKPLELNGGLLSQIQQLQESGHATVGFKGISEYNTIISVAKPSSTTQLGEDPEEVVHGEELDVNVVFRNLRLNYPYNQAHITQIRTIARRLTDEDDGKQKT